jgi:hypothetical protein
MSKWIEWTGGECPVEPGTKVRTRSRDGFAVTKVCEGDEPKVEWLHLPDNHPEWDIVAYRVVQP